VASSKYEPEAYYDPSKGLVQVGTGFSHLVVQVDDLAAALEPPQRARLAPGSLQHPGGPNTDRAEQHASSSIGCNAMSLEGYRNGHR
jgi:hypothetical protein